MRLRVVDGARLGVPDLRGVVMSVTTPVSVERQLIKLSKALDDATAALMDAERAYPQAKADLELALAEARMKVGARWAERGYKATVQEREDEALLSCRDEARALAILEGSLKAYRANVKRLETQVDIARSVGTSVRSSMEVA